MGNDDRKKVFVSQLFRPKAFDIDFPQKVFYGVFELPLLRNAQKCYNKRSQKLIKRKERYLPTPFNGNMPDIRRFQLFFLRRPLKQNDGHRRGWLVLQRPKKYRGWSVSPPDFFIAFFNSPYRKTPKNVINKTEK
jgi:hypothetical protein